MIIDQAMLVAMPPCPLFIPDVTRRPGADVRACAVVKEQHFPYMVATWRGRASHGQKQCVTDIIYVLGGRGLKIAT